MTVELMMAVGALLVLITCAGLYVSWKEDRKRVWLALPEWHKMIPALNIVGYATDVKGVKWTIRMEGPADNRQLYKSEWEEDDE